MKEYMSRSLSCAMHNTLSGGEVMIW